VIAAGHARSQDTVQELPTEAASAGFYQIEGFPEKYPKMQILTIRELLDGKGIDMPSRHANVTFKRAPRAKLDVGVAQALPLTYGSQNDEG